MDESKPATYPHFSVQGSTTASEKMIDIPTIMALKNLRRDSMAFRWWNSQAGYTTDINDVPECVNPFQAILILPKLCPFLQFSLPPATDPAPRFWHNISVLVGKFLSKAIPHPLSDFAGFVNGLYQSRAAFSPQTISECIDRLNPQDISVFCVYDCPQFFGDPLRYFDALLRLHDSNTDVWRTFAANSALVGAFFELHGNGMQSVPARDDSAAWHHRLSLAELLFALIRASNRSAKSLKFIDACLVLVGGAPLEAATVYLRYVVRLMRGLQSKAVKEQLQTRAVHLLHMLDSTDSPLFLVGLTFLLNLKPAVVSAARVIRMISVRGIRSLMDVEIVSGVADGSTVIPALIFLAQSALGSKLWHRACMEEIKVILLKFASRTDVREFFTLLVRRLFVFVAISTAKSRYRGRALLVCESLASFLAVKLLWLQQSVLTGAVSIFATRCFPAYFKFFFPATAAIDDTLIHEFEAFLNGELLLKTFPFDVVRGTLISPPIVDTSGQHPIPKLERCLTHGSIRKIVIRKFIQAGKIEPMIRIPGGLKQTRPLASAVCITPIHRR